MPAHVKCAMLGVDLNIPISNGVLRIGTWQVCFYPESVSECFRREFGFVNIEIVHHHVLSL